MAQNALAIFILVAGAGLIFGSQFAARFTDPLNERLTGQPHRDRRAYVLVGIGLIIVGISMLAGFA